ncbi:hypothetical protein V1478_015118 [Vespula squamosa]|uniref:Uncharacterized protein n=1 Tax=Vespula squamosa TaxID=30214 RepID=A0ABD2A6J8_VESSQ
MKSVVSYRRQSVHGLRETRNGGDAAGNGGGGISDGDRGGLRSTSHLGNNASDNGQRASGVSLKHALNSREPTNWLKRRELGLGRSILPPPPPPLPSPPPPTLSLTTTTPSSSSSLLLPPR